MEGQSQIKGEISPSYTLGTKFQNWSNFSAVFDK
jgi:hypothetical protein